LAKALELSSAPLPFQRVLAGGKTIVAVFRIEHWLLFGNVAVTGSDTL
jgi:hypothetical protein